MDKLSMAIIAMEAHVACSNERLRQAWEIIHAKLVEENGSSHNNAMDAIAALADKWCDLTNQPDNVCVALYWFTQWARQQHQ
jgi:hypothetical protein